MKIEEILLKLKKTSKKTEKENIIKENQDNLQFVKVLYMTYNSYINYYVRKIPQPDKVGDQRIDSDPGFFLLNSVLLDLSKRSISGNNALKVVKQLLESFVEPHQEVIKNILGRDLKGGFSESTINKAIPDLIPTFDVALAQSYNDKTAKLVDFVGSNWFVSQKLDGCRCIVIKQNGEIKFFSRTGKPFTTLNNLIPELMKLTDGQDNIVFDGEICIMDENGNEDFTSIMKVIKKKDYTIEKPMYMMFDCLDLKDFLEKTSEYILIARLSRLEHLFDGKQSDYTFIKQLHQQMVSEESFTEFKKKVEDFGWEGLILRKNSEYKGKRSNDILKVKTFYDAEYTIEDIEIGPFSHTVKGQGQESIECMTSVVINHMGWKVNVGSGFSIDERKYYMEHPEDLIGKEITVRYKKETVNKKGGKSLQFPTCKVIHHGRRDT